MLNEVLHHLQKASTAGQGDGSLLSLLALRVDVCPMLHQQLHHLLMPLPGSLHQGRVPGGRGADPRHRHTQHSMSGEHSPKNFRTAKNSLLRSQKEVFGYSQFHNKSLGNCSMPSAICFEFPVQPFLINRAITATPPTSCKITNKMRNCSMSSAK